MKTYLQVCQNELLGNFQKIPVKMKILLGPFLNTLSHMTTKANFPKCKTYIFQIGINFPTQVSSVESLKLWDFEISDRISREFIEKISDKIQDCSCG